MQSRTGVRRRTVLPLLLAPWHLQAQEFATDEEWAQFLRWIRELPARSFGNEREAFPLYQQHLIAAGMSSTDAEALAARVHKRSANNPEWMAVNFNRLYSDAGPARYNRDTPNAFLMETVQTLRPGRALDIGMGEGRNTIYLAQQGWNVTGIDVSDIGVAHAKERAGSLGLRIDARVQDVNRFDFGTSQWDLICLLYYVIPETQQSLYLRIADALKPGGHVIAEGFGLPVLDRLLQAWAKWEPTKLRLLRLEYRYGTSDWGGGGLGPLLLEKPA